MANKNKIFALLSVGFISALTFGPTLNTQAALSKPTTWHIGYFQNSTNTNWVLDSFGITFTNNPTYQRSGSSPNYNYTSNWDNSDFPTIIPNGLSIIMEFNQSNTSWSSVGASFIPSASSGIGSTNAVGSLFKNFMTFNNQTNKDYRVYFDRSSSPGNFYYNIRYDEVNYGGYYELILFASNTNLNTLYLPAFTKLEFYTVNSSDAQYFDAWYLQDLGVSNTYTQGYDVGFDIGFDDGVDTDAYDLGYSDGLNNNPNLLLNGFQAMVGILVNFALMILNLNVFGVSLLNIFGILALFVGLIWILKIVRG